MELPEQFSEENFVDAIYSVRSKMGVEGIFEGIDTLADIFSAFIEYGDDFYEYIPIESEEGEAKESDELIDLMITSYVKKFYFVIPAFILYMREQEAEYIDYISEFKVKPTPQNTIFSEYSPNILPFFWITISKPAPLFVK